MKSLILLLMCLFLVILCQAEIITIDADGPMDYNDTQASIDYTSNGGTVGMANGTSASDGNWGTNL